jgi:hypothetical protein
MQFYFFDSKKPNKEKRSLAMGEKRRSQWKIETCNSKTEAAHAKLREGKLKMSKQTKTASSNFFWTKPEKYLDRQSDPRENAGKVKNK